MAESRVNLGSIRKELESHLTRLQGELSELENGREAARQEKDEYAGYGNHIAEAASETSDAERDRALIDNLEQMRAHVTEALKRLDAGTYGTCTTCANPIPPERLEALPFAGQCVACKSKEASH